MNNLPAQSANLRSLPDSTAPTSPQSSWVVLKTRGGNIKTTRQTLKECDCEYFDRFLDGEWAPEIDKKGRQKLRLDVDHDVFRRTLTSMQTHSGPNHPPIDTASEREQIRQMRLLCHRPTLEGIRPSEPDVAFATHKGTEGDPSNATPEPPRHTQAHYVCMTGKSVGFPGYRSVSLQHFWYQSTPVTQGQWRALMGNNPSHFCEDGPDGEQAADRPVEQVSWNEAVAYCNALSAREGLPAYYNLSAMTGTPGAGDYTGSVQEVSQGEGYGYRLPTWYEQQSVLPSDLTKLDRMAWHGMRVMPGAGLVQ